MQNRFNYLHVDVFSPQPYSGNSLAVFSLAAELEAEQMQRITQELRHFETIFLIPGNEANCVKARVFDLFEELPFAGHPIIGAAAALHRESGKEPAQTWSFVLRDKTVSITTNRTAEGYYGLLDQGAAEFFGDVADREPFARAFGLSLDDLDPSLPLSVFSTGLRYLIVPVASGALTKARVRNDLSDILKAVNAQFAVLLDETAKEVRHWNNDGIIEDVATGSAAGTIGAYRLHNGRAKTGEIFTLLQGRFAGRPSALRVQPIASPNSAGSVKVGGDVAFVGGGYLDVLP